MVNLVIVAAVGVLVGLLTLLPAGEVRVLSETRTVRLGEFFGFRAVMLVVCVVLVVVAAIELLVADRPATIAAVGFGFLLLTTAAWIVTVEGVSRLIPRQILPPTARRFTIGLGVQIGPWLVAALCVVAVLACLGLLDPLVSRFLRSPTEPVALYIGRLGSFAFSLGGAVLFGFGRSLGVADLEWGGRTVEVEAWALPWIGPASLVVVLTLGIAAALAMAGVAVETLSLIGAGAAWLSASIAGFLIATSGLVVESDVIAWAARRVGQDGFAEDVVVTGGSGGAMLFAGALLAGVGFAGALLFAPSDRLGRSDVPGAGTDVPMSPADVSYGGADW